MTAHRSAVTSPDGTSIAYEAEGEGPMLVLVNDAFDTREEMRDLAAALAGRFTVVRYDRRGRGDSGDADPYAPAREIEDLGAIIEAVGGPAFVYGEGFGGVLGLDAVAAGIPIERLAVYEPPFVVDDSRPAYPMGFIDSLRDLLRADRRRDVGNAYERHGRLSHEYGIQVTQDFPFRRRWDATAHTLVYDYEVVGDRIAGRPLSASMGESIPIPVLVMEHHDSPVWLRVAVESLVELLPGGRKRTFLGNDRLVSPRTMAKALTSFLTTKRPVRVGSTGWCANPAGGARQPG